MACRKTRVTPRILYVVRPSAGGIVSSLCTLLTNNEIYAEVASTAETCTRVGLRWPGKCLLLPNDAFSIRQSLLTGVRLAQLVRASKTDVIHGHGITVLPALALAGMLTGLPVVLTLHNIVKASKVQTLILKLLCKRVHVIAVSNAILASAAVLGGLSAQRIYNGVMLKDEVVTKGDAREALGLHTGGSIVISVARLAPEKGLNVLAAAASDIPASIYIIGDGPEQQALSACDALHLVGHVDNPRLWYYAADIVAVPSLTEGLGLSAIEALAAGCPVIASNVGGLSEVIPYDFLGTCVPAGDVNALVSAIKLQLFVGRGSASDEAKRRDYVSHKFSVQGMLDETNALYCRILGS